MVRGETPSVAAASSVVTQPDSKAPSAASCRGPAAFPPPLGSSSTMESLHLLPGRVYLKLSRVPKRLDSLQHRGRWSAFPAGHIGPEGDVPLPGDASTVSKEEP